MADQPLDAHKRLGPAELTRNSSKTSRGPYHYTGPPKETGRILLKMESDVNASLLGYKVRRHPEDLAHLWKFRRTEVQYIKCNDPLAHGVSCGRLPSFAAPLL
jgi:hypothetical protein